MEFVAGQADKDTVEALNLYQSGSFQEAAALFASILDRTPEAAPIMRLQGLSLVRAGRTQEGLPLLARARRLAPADPLGHLHYGIGLLEAGRPARAAAMFRRSTAMLPNDPAPWINFSTAILALGFAPAARAAARRALRLAPQSAEAYYALGRAEWTAEDPKGARDAFAKAVRLSPAFLDAWLNLGLACFQLGHIGDATQAMLRALKVKPDFSPAEANLAGFMILQGDQEEALRRLRGVVERDPQCVSARLNLVNALLLDRQAREALALLDGVPPEGREGKHWLAHRAMALLLLGHPAEARVQLDSIVPPYGDAELLVVWRQLLLAERSASIQAAEALAERLVTLAERENGALLDHRTVSYFDVASFHARRGRHDRAFEYWKAGHKLLSRVQPFSREAFRQFVDANIQCFDAKRLREGACADISDDAPVFIVGLPRSGTSLTEQVLAAHPMVFGAGERAAFHRAFVRLAGPALQARAIHRFSALDESTLSAACRDYLAELHAQAPEARFIVDKMPGNALHLGALATMLPRARIIHCQRDPRDIGLSIFQLRFFGYHPYAHDLADLGWYIGEHERLMGHWHDVLPLTVCNIALSDWVNDFSGTLHRLLEFLGLPYDAACERFYEQKRLVRTASADQVRRPINARGLGRWRNFAEHLTPMTDELSKAGLISEPSASS